MPAIPFPTMINLSFTIVKTFVWMLKIESYYSMFVQSLCQLYKKSRSHRTIYQKIHVRRYVHAVQPVYAALFAQQ